MIEWGNLLEGLLNNFLPPKDKRELIKNVYDSRREICLSCPLFSGNAKLMGYESKRGDEHCTQCGCSLRIKLKSLSTQCPDTPPRWPMIMSDSERNKLESELAKDEESNT